MAFGGGKLEWSLIQESEILSVCNSTRFRCLGRVTGRKESRVWLRQKPLTAKGAKGTAKVAKKTPRARHDGLADRL